MAEKSNPTPLAPSTHARDYHSRVLQLAEQMFALLESGTVVPKEMVSLTTSLHSMLILAQKLEPKDGGDQPTTRDLKRAADEIKRLEAEAQRRGIKLD